MPHPLKSLAAGLLATSLFGCVQASDTRSAEDEQLDALHSPLGALNLADIQAKVERAYSAALSRANATWAASVDRGAGYVPHDEGGGPKVAQASAELSAATLHFQLGAQIAGPARQVRIRDAEHVATTWVEVDGRTAADAQAGLLTACHAYAALLPRDAGEAVDVRLLDSVQLVAAGAGGPFGLQRYGQTCAVYATTMAHCRQVGVHPLSDCTYVEAPAVQVRSEVRCDLAAEGWFCREDRVDAGAEDASFPPPVAPAIADALNDARAEKHGDTGNEI